MRSLLTATIAAFFTAHCAYSFAQQSADSVAPALPVITVIGTPEADYAPTVSSTPTRTDTPPLENPQSTQVIPRAVIQDQAAMSLSEVIRNVAGVQFDFGFNGSSLPLFILRGFPSVSMTASGPMSGVANYYLDSTKVTGVPVNMSNVQSIEVVKGPSSVLYGRAEPGGLVNIVTRPISILPQISFEQTIGQYDLSRSVLEVSGPLNRDRTFLGRAAASYFTTHSNRDFVQDRLAAFNGSLVWMPAEKSKVTFSLDYGDQRYRHDYGVPALGDRPADLPRSRQFNDAPELSSNKTTLFKLEGDHEFSDMWQIKAKALSVRSDTSEVDVLTQRDTPFLPCAESAPRLALCRYYLSARPDGRYRMDQFNTDFIGKLKFGEIKHTLLFGFDTYRSRKEGTTYFAAVSPVDIDNPLLGNTERLDIATAFPTDLEDRSKWTSVYVQDQIALGNRFFLTAALRHDKTSAIYAPPGTEPNKQSFTTPRLGAVWQFVPNQAVYAQYQDAIAANNGRNSDGEALAAERAKQFEIGYKIEAFGGRLTSTVAAYQLTKRNRADFSLFPLVTTVGEARSRGLEWDISGQLTKSLSLIGSYAYIDAVVTEDPVNKGKRLANVARHTASLWARYAFNSQWSGGAGMYAQGQRQGDIGNTFQLPGYARLDTMIAYRFALADAKAALQLNVDNVFDKLYYASSHQFVSDWIAPGAPRTIRVTFRLDY